MEKGTVNVLLAEDDRNLGNILKNYLDAKGYNTTLCVNGQEAVDVFGKKEIDFVILDIMMPVKDGFAAAKEIRAMSRKVPVLFLTAKALQEDKLKGFESGADDYITKPFSMEELLMRMHAILRRTDEGGKTTGNGNIPLISTGRYWAPRARNLSLLPRNLGFSGCCALMPMKFLTVPLHLHRSGMTTVTSMPAAWMYILLNCVSTLRMTRMLS